MVRHLSPEWLEAMSQTARAAVPSRGTGLDLVVQHTITDDPDADYHVTIAGSTVSVDAGTHPEPDVRFTSTAATAGAVASGQISAQQAFMAGDLVVGGDLSALAERQGDLAVLDDVFAEVRARTVFSGD